MMSSAGVIGRVFGDVSFMTNLRVFFIHLHDFVEGFDVDVLGSDESRVQVDHDVDNHLFGLVIDGWFDLDDTHVRHLLQRRFIVFADFVEHFRAVHQPFCQRRKLPQHSKILGGELGVGGVTSHGDVEWIVRFEFDRFHNSVEQPTIGFSG